MHVFEYKTNIINYILQYYDLFDNDWWWHFFFNVNPLHGIKKSKIVENAYSIFKVYLNILKIKNIYLMYLYYLKDISGINVLIHYISLYMDMDKRSVEILTNFGLGDQEPRLRVWSHRHFRVQMYVCRRSRLRCHMIQEICHGAGQELFIRRKPYQWCPATDQFLHWNKNILLITGYSIINK